MAEQMTHLELDPASAAVVDRLASQRRQTPDAVVREAISLLALREQLRTDLTRAWADYTETGLHLSAEEADAWMARLEAGEAAPMPPCHA